MRRIKILWATTLNIFTLMLLVGYLGLGIGIIALALTMNFTVLTWINQGYMNPWVIGQALLRLWYLWTPNLLVIMYSIIFIIIATKKTDTKQMVKEIINGIKNRS